MTVLPHVAFAIVAASFVVRDIFWLRCLAMLASAVALLFEGQQWFTEQEWRMASAVWHSLFLSINGYQVWHLVYGERHVRFTDEEEQLYATTFRTLTRLEFQSLLRGAQWRTEQPGGILARQDEELEEVLLVVSGAASVEVDGKRKAAIEVGQFIGEMSFVTGETASATVRVTAPTRCVGWQKPKLRTLLARNPSIRFALMAIMGIDMSKKLRRSSGEGADAPQE